MATKPKAKATSTKQQAAAPAPKTAVEREKELIAGEIKKFAKEVTIAGDWCTEHKVPLALMPTEVLLLAKQRDAIRAAVVAAAGTIRGVATSRRPAVLGAAIATSRSARRRPREGPVGGDRMIRCPSCGEMVVPAWREYDWTETHGLECGPYEHCHNEGYHEWAWIKLVSFLRVSLRESPWYLVQAQAEV